MILSGRSIMKLPILDVIVPTAALLVTQELGENFVSTINQENTVVHSYIRGRFTNHFNKKCTLTSITPFTVTTVLQAISTTSHSPQNLTLYV